MESRGSFPEEINIFHGLPDRVSLGYFSSHGNLSLTRSRETKLAQSNFSALCLPTQLISAPSSSGAPLPCPDDASRLWPSRRHSPSRERNRMEEERQKLGPLLSADSHHLSELSGLRRPHQRCPGPLDCECRERRAC